MKIQSPSLHILTLLFMACFATLPFTHTTITPAFTFLLFIIYFVILSISILVMGLSTLNLPEFSFLSGCSFFIGGYLLFTALHFPIIFFFAVFNYLDMSIITPYYLVIYTILLVFFISTLLILFFFYKCWNTSYLSSKMKPICQLLFLAYFVVLCIEQYLIFKMPSLFLSINISVLEKIIFLLILISTVLCIICVYKSTRLATKCSFKNVKVYISLLLWSYIFSLSLGLFHIQTIDFDLLCICLIYLCGVRIFLLTFHYSYMPQFNTFSDKLTVHSQNSILMNQYIENIMKSQESMVQHYSQVDAMYTQMMLFYPDALFIMLNDQIIHVNSHAVSLLGLDSPNDMLHTPFTRYLHEDSLETVSSILFHLRNHTISQETAEIEIITTQGNRIDIEALFILSRERGDDVFIISARDISDRKQQALLSQQVAIEKLKVEFFSTLSHELKTPVNIIYSAVQLQNNLLHTGELKKACHYNTMISQNCMRLLRLLNNLLDINRIESNYFSFNPQYINVVTLTESILTSIQPFAKRKNITPIFDTSDEDIFAYLDPDLFERILLNLFSNAIKYTQGGGHLWVTIGCTSREFILSVKDDGVGIPNNKLEHIFQRFFRVDNGLIRQAEGAGIGLSLVKSLVELSKGTINVQSHEGIGSEFFLTFQTVSPDTLTHFDESSFSYTTSKGKVEIEFSDVFIS